MDGEATVAALATCSGPDCLKDVVPKLGSRLKVYNAIKVAANKAYEQRVGMYLCILVTISFSIISVACRKIPLLLLPHSLWEKAHILCLSARLV